MIGVAILTMAEFWAGAATGVGAVCVVATAFQWGRGEEEKVVGLFVAAVLAAIVAVVLAIVAQ